VKREKFNFQLADGYILKKREKEISIDIAVELLLGKLQRRFTEAIRNDDKNTAVLTQHYVECPHCLNRVPAYARFLNPIFSTNKKEHGLIKRSRVEKWGERQMRMLYEDERDLVFNPFVKPKGAFKCPRCSKVSMPYITMRDVSVYFRRGKLTVSCEIINMKEMPVLEQLVGNAVINFPIYQRLIFNVKKGKTYVEVSDKENRVFIKRDITKYPYILTSSAVDTVLKTDSRVNKAIKKLLEIKNDGMLDIEKLITYTQFTGFDKGFYNAIPYVTQREEAGSFWQVVRQVDSSFTGVKKNLKNPEKAISLYENSTLPRAKSVRKQFFINPELLFYKNECELLFSYTNNVDCFLKVLKSKSAFKILSDLKIKPALDTFLNEYSKNVSAVTFTDSIISSWGRLCFYASEFALLSEPMRKKEIKKWSGDYFENYKIACDFSVPMRMPHKDIFDTVVDGFEFTSVKNLAQVRKLGESLNNCLIEWKADSNPIVCVSFEGKPVGAIELDEKKVKQHRTANNNAFEEVPALLDAYEKWRNKFNLIEDSYEFEDELPF
jgi:hypothetical protein